MAEAFLLQLAGSLLEKSTPLVLKEIKSCWGANDELDNLADRIRTIRAGLLDAENHQALSKLDEELRRRLSNVLHDADDLFDELITMKASRQIRLSWTEKVVEELHVFFSKSNPVFFPACVAGKINKIIRELDGIIKDTALLKLGRHSSDLTTISVYDQRETVSVPADEVIGREIDASKILPRLLSHESEEEEDFPDVISIVGIGGMGKTSLAQLLYNNEDVKKHFVLRAWACISDIKDNKQKARVILNALPTGGSRSGFSESRLERLRLKIQEEIANKKYLLVLDDFWDDDNQKWRELRALLKGGERGSKIVVTTRSLKVARVMGVDPHELRGLEDEKAEMLFERWAFMSAAAGGEDKAKLMEMGRKIVRKCKNVPLAIKGVASLLNCYGGDETKWKSVMNSDLVTIDQDENLDIMPILRLSYDHLPSHLKPCFAFCSVFPKNCDISPDDLVACWIAHGYVENYSDRVQTSLYKKGSDYLRELTLRSFLETKYLGFRYRMHDLMHDLARGVAGEEALAVNINNFEDTCDKRKFKIRDRRIRHLSFRGVQIDDDLLPVDKGKYVRSYICSFSSDENHFLSKAAAWKKFNNLRVLILKGMGLELLSSSVGGLKHLRSLLISYNNFRHLPDEITTLYNLMILDVSHCEKLESLPDELNRLINLKWLKLAGCDALRSMPRKFGELSSLETLDCLLDEETYGLEALAGFVNLRGCMSVEFRDNSGGGLMEEGVMECASVEYAFIRPLIRGRMRRLRDAMFVSIRRFARKNNPQWNISFNNLSRVDLVWCKECRFLPSFGRHALLTKLSLSGFPELEYVQVEEGEGDEFAAETHFPCLKSLTLYDLPKLKAWSPGMEKLGLQHQCISASSIAAAFPRFRSLNELAIFKCPELMSMPLPPKWISKLDVDTVELKEPLHNLLKVEQDCRSRGETSGMCSS